MKKALISLLAVVMCFTLTGCFSNKKVIDKAKKTIEETKEKVEENKATSEDEDLKLYSDGEKLVYKSANIMHVFYYSGEQITAYYSYIKYDNRASAEAAIKTTEKDDTMKDISVKGKYIVIEFAESQYKNLTVSAVKTAFSYMTEVTE